MTAQEKRAALIAWEKREYELKRITEARLKLNIRDWELMSDELVCKWFDEFFEENPTDK